MNPHEAARRLEWISGEYMLRWLAGTGDVTVTAFGEARATRCLDHPEIGFLNMVHRLTTADLGQVPGIAAHYAEAGIVPWLELMPEPDFPRLAEALRAVDGRHTNFLTVSERALPAPPPDPPASGVTIEVVDGPGEALDAFCRVLPAGHGVSEPALDDATERTRAVAGIEGARLYLARLDGVPAGGGVLLVIDELAYLANASTLEAHRRRGCQTALIQRRLADAAAAGCTRVGTITDWGSQSHANMARAGFTTAYTKVLWTLGQAPPEGPD